MRLTWILFRNIFPSLIRKGFFQILWVTNLKTCLFSIVGRIYSIILSNENSASEKSNVFLRFWTEFFVGLKIWLHIDPLILSRKKGKPCAKEIHHHIIEILYSFFFFFWRSYLMKNLKHSSWLPQPLHRNSIWDTCLYLEVSLFSSFPFALHDLFFCSFWFPIFLFLLTKWKVLAL